MILIAVILALAVGMIVGFILGVIAEKMADPEYPADSTGARKHDPTAGSEDDVQ